MEDYYKEIMYDLSNGIIANNLKWGLRLLLLFQAIVSLQYL